MVDEAAARRSLRRLMRERVELLLDLERPERHVLLAARATGEAASGAGSGSQRATHVRLQRTRLLN